MSDSTQNELFSAYLDGELTADEQAQVERLLSESPQARQLMDELRTLSHTLQAIPQYKVGEDLSAQVLRAAERKMLTGQAPCTPQATPAPRLPDALEPRTFRSTLRGMLSRRAVMWTSIAAAVAIFFALQDRQNQHSPVFGPVAHQADKAAKEPAADKFAGNLADSAPGEDESPKISPAPMVAAAPADKTLDHSDDEAAHGERKPNNEMFSKRSFDASNSSDASAPMADKGIVKDDDQANQVAAAPSESRPLTYAASDRAGAKRDSLTREEGAKEAGLASDGLNSKMAMGAARGGGNLLREKGEGAAPQLAQNGAPASAVATAGNGPGPTARKSRMPAVSAQQGVLVVQCEITREASEKHALFRLLAEEKLSPEPTATGDKPGKEVLSKGGAKAKDRAGADEFASQRVQLGDLGLVSVEATAEQLGAALDRMAAAPEEFLAVSVEPTAARAIRRAEASARQVQKDKAGDTPAAESIQRRDAITVAPGARSPVVDSPTAPLDVAQGDQPMEESEKLALDASGSERAQDCQNSAEPSDAKPSAAAAPDSPATPAAPASGSLAAGIGGMPPAALSAVPAAAHPAPEKRPETKKAEQQKLEATRYRVLFVVRVADEPAEAAAAKD